MCHVHVLYLKLRSLLGKECLSGREEFCCYLTYRTKRERERIKPFFYSPETTPPSGRFRSQGRGNPYNNKERLYCFQYLLTFD